MANPNILQWLHYQDIQIPDVILRTQFRQYVLQGNYTSALSLLQTNAQQLQGKAYIANTINQITTNIVALENNYYANVPVFLSNLAAQYYELINELNKIGQWSTSIQYMPYNFVIYNDEIYMCIIETPIGTVPTDDTYWLYLGLRGNQGDPGTDVVMQYDWNDQASYMINDLVVYQDNIYVAIQDNTGVVPTNETNWLLFLKIDRGQIYVGVNSPASLSDNTIWFNTKTDPSTQNNTNPIVGQFKRYVQSLAGWEDMYPNVLYTMVEGVSSYAQKATVLNITILQSQWANNVWTYSYPAIGANSIVDILPVNGMSPQQMNIYNTLTVKIIGDAIVLTATNSIDLSIRIRII